MRFNYKSEKIAWPFRRCCNSDITWAVRLLQLPANRLVVQQVDQVNNKENTRMIPVVSIEKDPAIRKTSPWQVVVVVLGCLHYNDVIMGAIASQITSLTVVFSTVYLDTDKRKHQISASLAFVRGIHRRPVNSPYKGPVTRKMFPFDDVIMCAIKSEQC